MLMNAILVCFIFISLYATIPIMFFCFRVSLSRLDSRRFAFCRAPADVFDRSSESDRRQSLLCRAVCAPAEVALGVVSGISKLPPYYYFLQAMQPPVMGFHSTFFSISCIFLCPFRVLFITKCRIRPRMWRARKPRFKSRPWMRPAMS
jgi:hypothetical protein